MNHQKTLAKQQLLRRTHTALEQFVARINNPVHSEDLVQLMAELDDWRKELQQEINRR